MISVLFYSFATIFVLFFLGFGLTLFLIPSKLNKYWFWLVPWFAIVFLIFILSILNLIGFSIHKSYLFVIGFLFFLNIAIFLLKKKIPHSSFKEGAVIIFFIIISLLFNLVSLLKYEKTLTTVSLGNNDAVNYAFTSDIIKTNLIFDSALVKVNSAGDMFHYIYRWGPPILTSFFLNLFHLQGYQFAFIIQAIIFSITLPLIYIIFSTLYKKTTLLSLVFLMIITAFNANLLYIIYHNFFGQVLFWGLGLFLIILFLFYLNIDKTKKVPLNIYEVIISVTLAVLFMSYSEAAIFIIGPLPIFLILKLYQSRHNFFIYLTSLARVAIITIGICAINLINGTSNVFKRFTYKPTGTEEIGWPPFRQHIPFPNPYEALGFYNIHSFEPLPFYTAIFLSILVVIVTIYGLLKIRHRLFIVSFLLVYLFLYYWTGIYRHNYFDYYKSLTYSLFLFLILFTVGFFELIGKKKVITIFFMLFIISFELFSAVKLNKQMNRSRLSVDESLISLSALQKEYNIYKEPIYPEFFLTPQTSMWRDLWREYFIYPKKLTYSFSEDYLEHYQNKAPDNSLVLLSKSAPGFYPAQVLLKKTVWGNKYYMLGRLCNSDACLLKRKEDLSKIEMGKSDYEDSLLISGWSTKEPDSRWAVGTESRLRLVTKDAKNYTTLTIEATTLKDPQQIDVYINDIHTGSQMIKSGGWNTYAITLENPLQQGIQKILFKYSNIYKPSDLGSSADTRELAVSFKKIELH